MVTDAADLVSALSSDRPGIIEPLLALTHTICTVPLLAVDDLFVTPVNIYIVWRDCMLVLLGTGQDS